MTIWYDPSDPGQDLAAVIDTGSAGRLFIVLHREQPGERLWDKDLAAL